MPNQDLIDYCKEEIQEHEDEIVGLKITIAAIEDSIVQKNQDIEQLNQQRKDVELNISNLEEGSVKLNEIIAILESQ